MAVILFAVSKVVKRLNIVSVGEISGVPAECRKNICVWVFGLVSFSST
jgi:hypothetical protein